MKQAAIIIGQVVLVVAFGICVGFPQEGKTPGPGPQYAAFPSHVAMATRALQLATAKGFSDVNLPVDMILYRLQAGAFSEDFDLVPGVVGAHFPEPWKQAPQFNFSGWYPVSLIPYGSVVDPASGWFRGLPHAYDPVQNFRWPGAEATTPGWANSGENAFSWESAVSLYKRGFRAEAYECLGHLLHLVADQSVPQHVKLVGAEMVNKRSGTPMDPDIAILMIDEYQFALNGGVVLPGPAAIIPDLSGEFQYALDHADSSKIPVFPAWDDYLKDLALTTYNHPDVNKYYAAPDSEGSFGRYRDGSGHDVSPTEYTHIPIGEISGRTTQFSIRGTARVGIPPNAGPVIPEQTLRNMCDDLVSRAVEYSAGLILYFKNYVDALGVREERTLPSVYELDQNYPNPFNPGTEIGYRVQGTGNCVVTLKVYDVLGREVATLVNERQSAGYHTVRFDGRGLATGTYMYRLAAVPEHGGNGVAIVKKMILAK